MNKKTRKLTFNGIMAAFAVVFVYISSVFPTGQLGFAAIASLFVAAAVIENGLISGLLVYVASSAVSLLIVPGKAQVLLYIFFFGYYHIVKSLSERTGSRIPWYAC